MICSLFKSLQFGKFVICLEFLVRSFDYKECSECLECFLGFFGGFLNHSFLKVCMVLIVFCRNWNILIVRSFRVFGMLCGIF